MDDPLAILEHLKEIQLPAWLLTLDWVKIISGAVPGLLGILIVWWKGGFKRVLQKYRLKSSLGEYRKELRNDVSTLPIIGRKEGFDLSKVYVPIEIARSDLMGKSAATQYSPPNVFVLVGGPGAGKSTYVKKELLDKLNHNSGRLAFFLRLRDYEKGCSIEDLLVRRLAGC